MTTSTCCSSSALRRVLFGAAALLLPLPATAATITWGTVFNISGDSDVSTAGTFVTAFNIGGSDTTVNGVLFTGTGTSGSDAGISNIGFPGSAFTSSATPSGSPFDLVSANYKSLLGTGGYVAFPSGTFTLSGLTIGNTYSFQVWANDSRGVNNPDSQSDIATRTSVFNGASNVTLFQNVGGAGSENYAGGLGQSVIGTFIADAPTQSIGTAQYALLSAYQIRDVSPVPEPSAYAALAGAFALGLVALRRRARPVSA